MRAFADDIAIVTEDVDEAAPMLHELFCAFGRISGLHLNMPKTFVVPLFLAGREALLPELLRTQPGWGGLRVEPTAKYLGFYLGPGRGHLTYDRVLAKYRERANTWGQAGGGLFATLVAYAVYVASVVGFVMQLDGLPPQWPEAEAEAVRLLVPGAGQFTCPDDVKHLDLLGFPRALLHIEARQRAAQLRVLHLEASASGGLRVRERAAALRNSMQRTTRIAEAGTWADWFRRSFLLQLADNAQHCRHAGITPRAVEAELLTGERGQLPPRPWTMAQSKKIRSSFQRTVVAMLPRKTPVLLEPRIRHKLERWAVPQFPRVRVANAVAFLKALRGRAPPRVWATAWRTIWNGWATNRRMQGRGGLGGCMFRCSDHTPDSIEHYANCTRLHAITERDLGLPRAASPGERLASFLGLNFRAADPPSTAVLVAVRMTAAYRTHCLCRHGQISRGVAAEEALRQACREAVRGDRTAEKIYDAVHGWA